jgi:hypothetical protein
VGIDTPGPAAGEAVLTEAVASYRAVLGPRLLAGYALGSLAHGGFSPLVSDVDLALILAGPLRPADRLMIRRVAGQVRSGGSGLHERLSVFWGSPATPRTVVGSRHWTGSTCWRTAACWPGRTPVRAWPGPAKPSCWWRVPSSR